MTKTWCPEDFKVIPILNYRIPNQIRPHFTTEAKFYKLWQIFEGLFSICQNFDSHLEFFHAIRQIFIVVKCPIIEKII